MPLRIGQEIEAVLRLTTESSQHFTVTVTGVGLLAKKLVPPARFEHAAYGLGNRRSIRLSYGGIGRRITPVE